jgi:hypothetical protein
MARSNGLFVGIVDIGSVNRQFYQVISTIVVCVEYALS